MARVFLFGVIFAIYLGFAYLPFIRSAQLTAPDTFNSHVHGISGDYYYYLSLIKQGMIQSHEVNQYTIGEVRTDATHTFYLFSGFIASVFGIQSNIIVYHSVIFLALCGYYLFAVLLVRMLVPQRLWYLTILLICFASPLPNWKIPVSGIDITLGTSWWTRMDPWNRAQLVPHHMLATTLFVGAVYFSLRFYKKSTIRNFIVTSLLCGIGTVVFGVPFFVFGLSIGILAGVYLIRHLRSIRKPHHLHRLGGMIIIGAICTAVIVIISQNIGSFGDKPWLNLAIWEYERYLPEIYPYQFAVLLFSYGILWLFIPFAIIQFLRKRRMDHLLLLCLFFTPLLLYYLSMSGILHVNKLRWVYTAPYVFGGILSALGINSLLQGTKQWFTKIIIGLIVISNLAFGLQAYWLPQIPSTIGWHIPDTDMQAMEYLRNNTPRFSGILTPYDIGEYLPAFTYNTVYIGHEVATKQFWRKWELMGWFYSGKMSTEQLAEFLNENAIEYAYSDSGGFVPHYEAFFTPIYQNGQIVIYKTRAR